MQSGGRPSEWKRHRGSTLGWPAHLIYFCGPWGPAFPLTGSYLFSCSPTPPLSFHCHQLSVLQASLIPWAAHPCHPLCPLLFQLSQCLGRQCTWLPPGLVAFPHQVPVGEGLCLSCLIDPLVPTSVLGTTAGITLVNVKTRQQAAGVEGPGPPPALAADP